MADDQITIRWSGGERRFAPGVVRLGRDPSNDVVIDNPHVSRQHGELRFDDGWAYTDVGSGQGTFVDDGRVTTVDVNGPLALRLGRAGGEKVELGVAAEECTVGRSRTIDSYVPDATVVVAEDRNRPGGALRADQIQGATVVTGHTVNVECGGRSYTFSPGQDVRIGRDLDCDIVSANPTVSRHHADLRYRDGAWVLEDEGSSGGTYLDGRRVKDVRLSGSTAVWLGEVDTGERVVLVTSGGRPRTSSERVVRAARKKTPIIVIGAIAAAAVVVAVVALMRPGGASSPSNDRLAKAVVRVDVDGRPEGSGTIIDAGRGLILTNAHVAAPRADGQGVHAYDVESSLPDAPRSITIAVSPGLDKVAEPTYTAEVAAADGYLDLVVLRITGTVGGAVVESDDLKDLTAIEIGDSDALRTGSSVRVFGFPAISQSNASTLTEGVVSGPVEDRRLRSNRAFLNLDAPIRGGNSGGLAADADGRLVGVPTLNRIRKEEAPVSSMRPVNWVKPMVDAVREGKPYASPYVTPLTGKEAFENFASVTPGRAGFDPTCAGGIVTPTAGSTALALAFQYKGFTAGQPQDVRVDLFQPDGKLVATAPTEDQWPYQWGESGCATVTLALGAPLTPGTYVARVYAGPNYRLLARLEVPVS
jgi:pSer/pThr/pTyr-binding forkhead associated (FHA) protein